MHIYIIISDLLCLFFPQCTVKLEGNKITEFQKEGDMDTLITREVIGDELVLVST